MKTNKQFSCKPITKADFDEWLVMGKKLWPRDNHDLKLVFKNILKSPKETALICRTSEGDAVGFATLSVRSDYVEGSNSSPVGYVEGIFVEKKYRGKGVARMLLRRAEEWAHKKGCREMGSDTELKNLNSQKFHKAVEFKEAEKIVAFIKKIRR